MLFSELIASPRAVSARAEVALLLIYLAEVESFSAILIACKT